MLPAKQIDFQSPCWYHSINAQFFRKKNDNHNNLQHHCKLWKQRIKKINEKKSNLPPATLSFLHLTLFSWQNLALHCSLLPYNTTDTWDGMSLTDLPVTMREYIWLIKFIKNLSIRTTLITQNLSLSINLRPKKNYNNAKKRKRKRKIYIYF